MAIIIFRPINNKTQAPLAGVIADSIGGPGPWGAESNPCGDMTTDLAPGDYEITFSKPGFESRTLPASLANSGVITVGLEPKGGSGPGPRPEPIRRGSIALPQPVDYDIAVPALPGPDKLFYRGNFCGIRLPGAPLVAGGPNDPSLVMACLLDNYPREWQDRYLALYASYSYTHLQRSIGHSLWYGGTVDSHIELSNRAHDAGLWCDEWLLGGEALKTPDQDARYWKPILDPIIDAFLAAGTMDTCCVGWQLDQLNQNAPGQPTQSLIDYVSDRVGPHDIPLGTHWMNEAGAWWLTGGTPGNRFDWWAAQRNKLSWFHHQGDVNMALKLYQDKLKDTLDPFGGDNGKGVMGKSGLFGDRPYGLVAFEYTAQNQFDGRATEAEGDARGLALVCTRSHTGLLMSGYGNGARRQDGTAL